jgi:lipopolysaccharide transport system permease protein
VGSGEEQATVHSDDRARTSLSRKTRSAFGITQWIGWLQRRFRRDTTRRTILVARRGRLGDVVAILPLLESLRAHLPGSRIVLGVDSRSPARALLGDSKLVDAIRVIDPGPEASRFARLSTVWSLLAERFDALIVGENFSQIDLAFLCGAPLRIALDDGAALTALCNRRVALDPDRPVADNHLALAEMLGAAPRHTAAPRLHAPADPAPGADPLVPLGAAPFVVLHPGSQRPSRRWPAERFAALAGLLLADQPDLRIVLTGTADEAALNACIVENLDPALRARCLDLSGATDLSQLLWILSRARSVVCNDTGVMHAARALGTPLVALLGPENHAYWGPHPDGFGPAIAVGYEVPCAPCSRWHCEPHFCLRSLGVDQVFEAVSRLLGASGNSPRSDAYEREMQSIGWESLARNGHAVPPVTHVRVQPKTATSMRAWPGLGGLRLTASSDTPGGRYPTLAAERRFTPPGKGATAWEALLAQTQGELILLDAAPDGALAADPTDAVARLVREPELDAVAMGAADTALLVRRSRLEECVRGDRFADPLVEADARREGWSASLRALGREVWKTRDLLLQITQRDIRIRYKQAVMGFAWAILTPALILSAGILVRSAMAFMGGTSLGGPDVIGMAVKALPWSFFVGSLGFATSSLTGNLELVTKVAFPRIILPISATLAAAFDTAVGSIGVGILFLVLGAPVSPALAWVPLLVAITILLTAASAVFLSCANLFFRDVKYIVQLLLTFGIFFTPVFFEPYMLGEVGSRLLMLNPLAPVLEGLRLSVAYSHDLALPLTTLDARGAEVLVWTPWYLVYSAAWGCFGFAASAIFFRRLEHLFAEYV